jgi:hypothetical protein
MLRKALDAKATVIVFIDHDLSWPASALLQLIETPGDVVAGTYRYKHDSEEYMGTVDVGPNSKPMIREDGCIKADFMPAGFLKVTRNAINQFAAWYPELLYGETTSPHIDLFNHGAHEGMWYGEDYAFCRRWITGGGDVWCKPDLDLTHHGDKAYPGNFHRYLLQQPGGANDPSKPLRSFSAGALL